MLEEKRASGTTCSPDKAWESRDAGEVIHESPLQPTSLSDEPGSISSPGGVHQEQSKEVCRALLFTASLEGCIGKICWAV